MSKTWLKAKIPLLTFSKQSLISPESDLIKLYNSSDFIQFLETVLGISKIYPYKDTLSSINYNYYEKGYSCEHCLFHENFDNVQVNPRMLYIIFENKT